MTEQKFIGGQRGGKRDRMTEQTPDAPAQAPPCIHTVETGKHEWNCFHWVHQAHAPFSYPQCPTCGWIDLDLMVKEAGLVKADAPGGERAQDEPQVRDRADLLRDAIGTMLIANAVAPSAVYNLGRFAIDRDNRILTASPRPAEPEPPKAEQEPCRVPPTGWYCTRGAGHDGPCAARSTDGNEQAWEDLAADGGLPESQPKADTVTLETRLQDAMRFYGYNGGMVDLLRDALIELRRRQEEYDELRRAVWQTHSPPPHDAVVSMAKEQARASSPDLRALVEKEEGPDRDRVTTPLEAVSQATHGANAPTLAPDGPVRADR